MPVLRVDAIQDETGLRLSIRDDGASWDAWNDRSDPVIVLCHGYKYHPNHRDACPHTGIFGLSKGTGRATSWISALQEAGLPNPRVLAFGWNACGSFDVSYRRAGEAGAALAKFLGRLNTPKIHMIGHSLGARVCASALEAMESRTAAKMDRVLMLSPALRQAQLQRAALSEAGRIARIVSVGSAENKLFDFLFQCIAPRETPPLRDAPLSEVTYVSLDCSQTLHKLARIGIDIAPPHARVCHWSTYLRPGVFNLYAALLDPKRPLSTTFLRRLIAESKDVQRPRTSTQGTNAALGAC